VRSGAAVISLARWNLCGQEISNLFGPGGGPHWPALNELRARRGLPRFVRLADGPGGLLLDLDNPLAAAAAITAIRGKPKAALEEMWPDPDHLAARGPEGRYTHQLIVPFERVATTPRPAPATTAVRPPSTRDTGPPIRRSFPPGSEWLSVKVYCGGSQADRLLAGPIAEVIDGCDEAGDLDGWFFIRYADPAPHLRIRLRGSAAPVDSHLGWREHLERMLNREFDRGGIQSISYDTYRREVERFGGPAGILVAEEMFKADSRAALDILPSLRGDDNETRRWVTALVGLDRLLDGLGLDLRQRHRVVGQLRRALETEFRVGPKERAAILTRQRPVRGQLLRLLAGESVPDLVSSHTQDSFDRRSQSLRPHGDALRLLLSRGELSTHVESVAGVLAHLSVNRLLRGAHRRHELVLTSFLDRLYDSIGARLGTRR
jgi:thiopeptide-type bacteriocin biosynthesis protein